MQRTRVSQIHITLITWEETSEQIQPPSLSLTRSLGLTKGQIDTSAVAEHALSRSLSPALPTGFSRSMIEQDKSCFSVIHTQEQSQFSQPSCHSDYLHDRRHEWRLAAENYCDDPANVTDINPVCAQRQTDRRNSLRQSVSA